MQSSLQSREDFDLLKLSGEIDLEYSPKVREQILASLKAGNALLIDLADVKYIDNSGIASLVEGLQAAKTAMSLDCTGSMIANKGFKHMNTH